MTDPWVPWALGTALALIVVFVAVLVAGERRKEGTVGRHSWLTDRDVDDSGGDVELLAAVTGLGEEREAGREAWAAALDLSAAGWDLRGVRDRDQDAPHPWRES